MGTDDLLARHSFNSADKFIEWYNESFFGEMAKAVPGIGYVAPPLDGVWATAPYLHNGSVPTLKTLLDSSARPQFWRRGFSWSDYDSENVGWTFTSLEYGKDGEPNRNERIFIYDTTRPGYGNQGHTYGDGLNDNERDALIEYLKTL